MDLATEDKTFTKTFLSHELLELSLESLTHANNSTLSTMADEARIEAAKAEVSPPLLHTCS